MKILKNEIIIPVVLIVLIAGTGAIAYYLQQNQQPEMELETETPLQNNEQEQQMEENKESEASEKTLTPQEELMTERTLEDNLYSIIIPSGWVQAVATSSRFVAIVIKPKGEINPENLSDVDYDTYYAVNNTKMNAGSLDEYVDILKQNLKIEIPSITFPKQTYGVINGHDSIFLESESSDKGKEYKTLLVFVDDGAWVWALSFNTPAESWTENKDLFYRVARSLEIK